MRDKALWIRLAAISGLVSVAAGAFAAHGASNPESRELLRTGASYEAIHALAVLAWAALTPDGSRCGWWTPTLFLSGAVFFSGSLYALAVGAPHWTGALTPMGGVMFLAGWATFAWTAGRRPPR